MKVTIAMFTMLKPLIMKKIVLLVLLSFFFCFAKAGGLYGGEITYTKTSGFTFHFKLTLYLNGTLNPGWDSALVLFGDGTGDMLIKSSEVFIDSAHVWKFDMEGDHTYPGIGTYVVAFSAPNRPSDIVNINGGNSVNEPFYIEDTLFIHDPELFPFDHSISFPHLQTEVNYDGVTLTHNAQVSDADADSITYQLIVPAKGSSVPVGNYVLPDEIPPTPSGNSCVINDNGLIVWQSPWAAAKYCVAIKATLWKYGVRMGTVIRDMIITVDVFNSVNEMDQPPFHVYPNPVTDWLTIVNPSNEDALFELYDVFGRQEAAISLFHSFKNYSLYTGDLPAGTYLVVVRQNTGKVWSEKVVVY